MSHCVHAVLHFFEVTSSAASDAAVIWLQVEEEQEIKTEQLLLQGIYLEQLHLMKHHFWLLG